MTGKRSLFVGYHAREIAGMPQAESDALLAELHDFATQPAFCLPSPMAPP